MTVKTVGYFFIVQEAEASSLQLLVLTDRSVQNNFTECLVQCQ